MAKESFFSVKEIFSDRRKLSVFLTCLGVSLFMWLLISLGKEYNRTVLVPLKFVNFPQNKTLLNEVSHNLAVNIGGSGFDLLQYADRLTDDTLNVNLDNLKLSSYGEFQRGYLDQGLLSKDLQERLNGVLAINSVLSDSIRFVFDLKVARTLSVAPQVNLSLPPGYVQVDSLIVVPNEVYVYGALSMLDALKAVETEPAELGELTKVRTVKLPLSRAEVGADAELSVDSVSVTVLIDKLTEKRFMITPEQRNVPDSVSVITFPSSIEVSAQVPLSKFDEISSDDFHISIDYNKLQSDYLVLPVELEEWSPLAHQTKVIPSQVELVVSIRE